jgi:uncharacterized protein (UPF0335 family)
LWGISFAPHSAYPKDGSAAPASAVPAEIVREDPLRAVNRNQSKQPEVALSKHNEQVKSLIQKLGEAIHESVSESEDIAEVVREIREQGFDVILKSLRISTEGDELES